MRDLSGGKTSELKQRLRLRTSFLTQTHRSVWTDHDAMVKGGTQLIINQFQKLGFADKNLGK